MLFCVNDLPVEITEITAINPETSEREDALLYHDVRDEYRDGDMVFFQNSMPKTDEEAMILITNEFGYSDSEVIDSIQ